ncbi:MULTISPECIES: universal stress protein [unclassified Haladaptatus]|uniref:universal stress protein n=1 Tax=unclassified Haladaptatus TaxID=2622732 RepID=UPI0023E8EE6D|nr:MULTISPECIES: universal stress protein [unclassified Haladaptatus]
MTFLVPFDGSSLAEAALVRAVEFAKVFDEKVVAVSIIPLDDETYAQEKGWLATGDPFDRHAIVAHLHEQVTDLAPTVDFSHEFVGRYASSGSIALAIRKAAKEFDTSMLFIGSENAGRLVNSLASVGSQVTADQDYDVVIVRDRTPAKIERLKRVSPFRKEKSDFYLSQ